MKKKSFLLYFDACRQIMNLPDEQLGILFRAVVDCAAREAEGKDGTAELERRFPRMEPVTQMAFRFLADMLHRDALAYTEKCANYQTAARRRAEEQKPDSREWSSGRYAASQRPTSQKTPPQEEPLSRYVREFMKSRTEAQER